ncbi:hypothetical protein AKO1_013256 [Acrasis kona]|uniref:Protein kinase domain-containing protein n=1 Tax=Acrasis kona TaxID=1008807 RepID=A0AAW2YZN7_9EUKA
MKIEANKDPKRQRTSYSELPSPTTSPSLFNDISHSVFDTQIFGTYEQNSPDGSNKRKRLPASTYEHMGTVFFHDQHDTIMSQIRMEVDDDTKDLLAKKSSFIQIEQNIISMLGPRHPYILQPVLPAPDMSEYEGEWDDVILYDYASPINRTIGRLDALSEEKVDSDILDSRFTRMRQFLRQSLGALSVCHSRFIVHNNISLHSAFLAGEDKNVKLCGLEHAIKFESDQVVQFRSCALKDLQDFSFVIAELALGRKIENKNDMSQVFASGHACTTQFKKQSIRLRKLIKDLYNKRIATAQDALQHSYFQSRTHCKEFRELELKEKTRICLMTVNTSSITKFGNNKTASANTNMMRTDKENVPPQQNRRL